MPSALAQAPWDTPNSRLINENLPQIAIFPVGFRALKSFSRVIASYEHMRQDYNPHSEKSKIVLAKYKHGL